jgi:hypothetical protein
MIALKGYVRNLFEGFEVDEAVEEYILIDIPFKHKNIFGGGVLVLILKGVILTQIYQCQLIMVI